MSETIIHPLAPIVPAQAQVLILGTMPSPRSRSEGFYYAHPQNRFWRVLAALFGDPVPADNAARTELLFRHGIALWDVLASCSIRGADDASIKEPVANDIRPVLGQAPIKKVFTTGKKAADLYRRYILPTAGVEAEALPSTSAANCRTPMESLLKEYSKILDYCV
ncbi:MAG: DNA-deoxyinosine glycosylase [Christensenellaceae bacterium]|nr:DNA-deoxyinosine glycosylase [Christensenellaceae bacterium]